MDTFTGEIKSQPGCIFRIALGAELIASGLHFAVPIGWLVALLGLVPTTHRYAQC